MLDVHPPHEPVHGWRDFLLHLVTITIGLLIALSLEGLVEWQHHRHLVHEAEASLRTEIRGNGDSAKSVLADIKIQQDHLTQDVRVLRDVVKTGKLPADGSMTIDFHLHDFSDVSWKTAETTGALAYMPYRDAQEFAEIYTMQDQLNAAQGQAARDAIISLASFMNSSDKDVPSKAEAALVIDHIQVLQGQLLLVESLAKGLDAGCSKFLAAHP